MTKIPFLYFFLFSYVLFAQGKEISYEQIAVNFFADNLLDKKEPFINKVAYFDGEVNNSLTDLDISCISEKWYGKANSDSILDNYYSSKKENKEKPAFRILVPKPIKKKYKKLFAPKKHTLILEVHQNLNITNKNYVLIRMYDKDYNGGKELYLTMNTNGKVIDWCYYTFMT
jgi:hypothetical protein